MKALGTFSLVDFLCGLGLLPLYIWLHLTASDRFQKLLQMLNQMLMAIKLPGNEGFSEMCQVNY